MLRAFWYRLAAEKGDALAQFKLGLMYESGEGVPQDFAEAVRWYRLDAEQGSAAAQAHGASQRGRSARSCGHAASFSFYPCTSGHGLPM